MNPVRRRLFVMIVRQAKVLSTRGHPLVRVVVAGAVLGATVVLAHFLSDDPVSFDSPALG